MQKISDIMSNINRIIDGKNYKDLTEEDINKLIDYMVDLAQALSDAGTTLSYILSDLATISSILTPEMKEALDKAGRSPGARIRVCGSSRRTARWAMATFSRR